MKLFCSEVYIEWNENLKLLETYPKRVVVKVVSLSLEKGTSNSIRYKGTADIG